MSLMSDISQSQFLDYYINLLLPWWMFIFFLYFRVFMDSQPYVDCPVLLCVSCSILFVILRVISLSSTLETVDKLDIGL